MANLNFKFPKLLPLLLIPILYELVIGGGGRYLEMGPLTARMLFFVTALFISFLYYYQRKTIKKNIFIITILFTLTSLLALIIGVASNAETALIIEDIKPLSFFYMILFFSFAIKDIEDIKTIVLIIKRGSIILGTIFVIVIVLLLTGIINFLSFYSQQNDIGEIMFRNDTLFFYKGFIYLCIGFFFFLFSDRKYSKLAAFFLFICIVLTLTRGFLLFTCLITLYYILFINKNKIIKVGTLLVSALTIVVALPSFLESLGNKSESDKMRYLQIEQVIDAVNPLSLVIGHGFGVGVPIRQVHMELSFLEVFHKQGLIGIALWFGILAHIFFMFISIKDKHYKKIAIPFFYSVIFVVLQSGTNPYINNPIGLTMVLVTIVVFSRLLEFEKKKNEHISLHRHV